ncbi:hypothetical protein ACFV2Q_38940 [Streptomyces sp. NPDC059650]
MRGEWFDLTPLGDPATAVTDALAALGLDIRLEEQGDASYQVPLDF